MIPADRYCHSGPGNGDNSILTKIVSYALLSWDGSVLYDMTTWPKILQTDVYRYRIQILLRCVRQTS